MDRALTFYELAGLQLDQCTSITHICNLLKLILMLKCLILLQFKLYNSTCTSFNCSYIQACRQDSGRRGAHRPCGRRTIHAVRRGRYPFVRSIMQSSNCITVSCTRIVSNVYNFTSRVLYM